MNLFPFINWNNCDDFLTLTGTNDGRFTPGDWLWKSAIHKMVIYLFIYLFIWWWSAESSWHSVPEFWRSKIKWSVSRVFPGTNGVLPNWSRVGSMDERKPVLEGVSWRTWEVYCWDIYVEKSRPCMRYFHALLTNVSVSNDDPFCWYKRLILQPNFGYVEASWDQICWNKAGVHFRSLSEEILQCDGMNQCLESDLFVLHCIVGKVIDWQRPEIWGDMLIWLSKMMVSDGWTVSVLRSRWTGDITLEKP